MESDGDELGRKAAAAASLRAAGAKLDSRLQLSEDEVDEAIEDFERLRKSK